MKNNEILYKNVIIIFCIQCLLACKFQTHEVNLDFAKSNKTELTKVYDKYMLSGDTLKQEGVIYLLENMPQHFTATNKSIEAFTSIISTMNNGIPSVVLDSVWYSIEHHTDIVPVWDAENLTYDFLVRDIDTAYAKWHMSSWKEQVPFKVFCEYILPYRILNEPLEDDWRNKLYERYHGLTDSITDVKQAFVLVYKHIKESLRGEEYQYHYPLLPSTMWKIMRGNCIQRCIYMTQVMKALSIPVAIDWVRNWANYSVNGHYWVSLVLEDGTYVLSMDGESVVKYGEIDSSIFKVDFAPEPDYKFQPTFKKRCAKVFRYTYRKCDTLINDDNKIDVLSWLQDKHSFDVSHDYGYDGRIEVKQTNNEQLAFLCTYVTASGWKPITVAIVEDGKFTFEHLNDSVVYMCATFQNDKINLIGEPIMLTADGVKIFKPNTNSKQIVVLDRKYPLTGRTISACAAMKGTIIQASCTSDFKQSWNLCTIAETPSYRNVYRTPKLKRCQYLKFLPAEGRKYPVAEIEVLSYNNKLQVKTFGNEYSKVYNAIDNNILTTTKNILPSEDKCLKLDLEGEHVVTDIILYPATDDNYVIPNNMYELYYFNAGKWVSLGKKISKAYSITYDNVPSDALLLLRNLTKGREERIFTYENNQQVWW